MYLVEPSKDCRSHNTATRTTWANLSAAIEDATYCLGEIVRQYVTDI